MMDMIEKVARALYAIRMEVAEGTGIHEPYVWETDNNAYREHCLREARAAIEAMRNPPRDVLTAFVDADVDTFVAGVRWEAAIDAALTPSPASK